MSPPHEWPLRVRGAVLVVAVVVFAAGAGVAAVDGHKRTHLPVNVVDVETAETNTTHQVSRITALDLTVRNSDDDGVTVGVWVFSDRQRDYAYWRPTSSREISLAPGETKTVTVHAPHESEVIRAGNTVAVTLMTLDGVQRSTSVFETAENGSITS